MTKKFTPDERALIAVNAALYALDYVSDSLVDGLCDEVTMQLLAARQALGVGEWSELPSPHNDPSLRDLWLEINERHQRLLGLL